MLVASSCQRLGGLVSVFAVVLAALHFVDRTNADDRANEASAGKSAMPGDALIGEWWTENNEGRVRMARYRDGTYRGTTTCCEHKGDDNNPNIDIHNPKPELRKRSTIGIVLIWNLKYEDGEFVDGHVYNPRDGKTYRMKMEVVDREILKVRGYMGIPLLGQTQIWKRAHVAK
jgi:uncharacterized protein (DUF2147 family)